MKHFDFHLHSWWTRSFQRNAKTHHQAGVKPQENGLRLQMLWSYFPVASISLAHETLEFDGLELLLRFILMEMLPSFPSCGQNLPDGHIHDRPYNIFSTNGRHWHNGVAVSDRHADETNMILTSHIRIWNSVTTGWSKCYWMELHCKLKLKMALWDAQRQYMKQIFQQMKNTQYLQTLNLHHAPSNPKGSRRACLVVRFQASRAPPGYTNTQQPCSISKSPVIWYRRWISKDG